MKALRPIPVARPRMPATDALVPYLQQIDKVGIYSNNGPLARRLEDRLAAFLGVPPKSVVAAASGSAALTGSILAHAGYATDDRRSCLMPGIGFVSAAAAVKQCGYATVFCDVDPASWQIEPGTLVQRCDLDSVGLVLPVAPYGKWIDLAGWAEFSERTRIPVVIDAAASLDSKLDWTGLHAPACISFHATKVLGSGEGGAIVCRDSGAAEAARAAINHGFKGSRSAHVAAINGKMSEYAAAVALAGLDALQTVFPEWEHVRDTYMHAESPSDFRLIAHPEVSRCYLLAEARDAKTCALAVDRLQRLGVGARFWYGRGLHLEPAFTTADQSPLPVTEDLSDRLLGLPMARDLTEEEIRRVLDALGRSDHE